MKSLLICLPILVLFVFGVMMFCESRSWARSMAGDVVSSNVTADEEDPNEPTYEMVLVEANAVTCSGEQEQADPNEPAIPDGDE